ncbi:MAG: protein translocase subunit SecD [Desulfovibrionaceae bacterium]|nr:protein translocase subunit SecD [Desulfovibrionaceae bacterium]
MKSISWRIAVSLLVLLIGLAYVLPSFMESSFVFLPSKRISLGLDLKGGMHLTLGVETDKAVSNSLALSGQELRIQAAEKGLTVLRSRLTPDGRLEFLLPRESQRADLEQLLKDKFPQLAIDDPVPGEGGGLRFFASYTDEDRKKIEDMALDQAVRTIRNRIDQFGVAEPDIRKLSDFRIQIQLPGMTDAKRAVQLVGQTAQLTFHLVRDDLNPQDILPPGVAPFPMTEGGDSGRTLLLDKEPLMTGEDVADARPSFDGRDNSPCVSLAFNARGAAMFERVTGENVKHRMAIVLDGKVYSAPTIQERIGGGHASITGRFTAAEAQDLAIVLRAGSLPAPVKILEERTVGPSLGEESIRAGILAAIVGAAAVVIMMPLYYGIAGLLADVMLSCTILLLLGGLAGFGATLTLPGIAGIVLTIGMSVDANVLIFERIREEIRYGRNAVEAVRKGFDMATVSIVDSNLTTIIAAAILYQFGTGPVRGFAVTLTLGILASMFTAIFMSRTAFGIWLRSNGGKSISI